MKIVLTKTEVAALVRKAYNLDPVVEVELLDITIPDEALRAIEQVKKLNYKTNEKIMSIKTLREGVPGMGLAEAKYIVENFDRYLAIIQNTGRLPVIRSEGGYCAMS